MDHHNKRSFTGHHNLLPARSHSGDSTVFLPYVKLRSNSLLSWTFGRGTVIWRIWPAVAIHIIFAAGVVYMSLNTKYSLAIPPVLLTVLGVILGFVISYRAMTGYDRYWMGRTCWSDVIRTTRAMGRIIWLQVPPCLTPLTHEELQSGEFRRERAELMRVMKEKRMAMDLIEGFAVALKHHVRGEMGLYYEDLYHLIQPLHDHRHTPVRHDKAKRKQAETIKIRSSRSHPSLRESTSQTTLSRPTILTSAATPQTTPPPVSIYGTFNPSTSSLSLPNGHGKKRSSRVRAQSMHSEVTEDGECDLDSEEHHLIQSSELPAQSNVLDEVEGDLIPFRSFFSALADTFWNLFRHTPELPVTVDQDGQPKVPQRKWSFFSRSSNDKRAKNQMMARSRPRLARGGENLPLDVLRVLAEWLSVLESRGTVPGSGLGGMYGCVNSFEDSLSALERILTTPLPFVYSVHIRHTVWIYLFFLPFQMIEQFGWSTVPGVGIAAFIYLGFLAAGEEIEQPFGYDENDLDLDLYTGVIIHEDLAELKKCHCRNAFHTHKATKMANSISVTVEEAIRANGRHRNDFDAELDEEDETLGDGYGLTDDLFGISESLPS